MRKFLPTINLIALIVTIFVNYLANALPFNGKTTGEISDQFDILFKPAGYAFSIWGIIYLVLFAFVIFQILPSQRNSKFIEKIGPYFLISSIANMLWLLVWHYELFALSLVVMLILLLSLIKIYTSLDIGLSDVKSEEKWLVHFPFSLYLGWISVATIVNISIYLDWINWSGFGFSSIVWLIIVSFIGVTLSFIIAIARKDLVFNLVIAWAYVAVAFNNLGILKVSTISWGAAIISIIPVFISALQNLKLNNAKDQP